MPHPTTMKPQTLTLSGGHSSKIVLGAPAHDDLTEYTAELLANIHLLSGSSTLYCKFSDPLTYDQLLVQRGIKSANTFLIFGGHGDESQLLGPGAKLGAANCRKLRSPFYTSAHIYLGPRFMLAFCCWAGVQLGDWFENQTAGRTFVGFEDELYLVLADGDYATCWTQLLVDLAKAMLNAPDLQSLEKAVQDSYQSALNKFPPHQDKKNRWGMLMRGYLRRQSESVRAIIS